MVNYRINSQSQAIGKDADGNLIRQFVYYPAITDVQKMDVFHLFDNIMDNGNTAFTYGEWIGVSTDLGTSVASQLINGYKVVINRLGTFEPRLVSNTKNVKDPSDITAANLSLSVSFTPAEEFKAVLAKAEWKRVATAAKESTGSKSYTLSFSKQDKNNNLAFVCSKPEVLAAVTVSGITATINGVSHSDIAVAGNAIYLNGAVGTNSTLTDATIVIHMPAVTVGSGEQAVSYPAADYPIKGVTQSGPTSSQGNVMD